MKKRSRRYIAKKKNPLWWMEIMVQHAADRIEDMARRSQPKFKPGMRYSCISHSSPMVYIENGAEVIKNTFEAINEASGIPKGDWDKLAYLPNCNSITESISKRFASAIKNKPND